MDDNQPHLFDNFQFNEPVTEDAINALEKSLGVHLPTEYLRILAYADGMEGVVGQRMVSIWTAEDIIENNKTVEAPRLIPGILLIGSVGEDEALAIDLRENYESYGSFFLLPFTPLDWDEAEPLGATVEDAFEKLKNPFSLPDEESKTLSEEA